MKKRIQIKSSYLFAAITLFIIYYFWFAPHNPDHPGLFSANASGCNVKNGDYPVTIDYYNTQSKAELTIRAVARVEDCYIVKIKFSGEWKLKKSISLPVEMETNRQAIAEDNDDGLYMIHLE